jgi:hypothetical protein
MDSTMKRLSEDKLRETSRSNTQTTRQQRAPLEAWEKVLDLAEEHDILPIDILAAMHDLCGDQIERKLTKQKEKKTKDLESQKI